MGLSLNHLPKDVAQLLAKSASRSHRSVEEVALKALERGLAFETAAEDESATDWIENPQFDAALHAFAEMEKE